MPEPPLPREGLAAFAGLAIVSWPELSRATGRKESTLKKYWNRGERNIPNPDYYSKETNQRPTWRADNPKLHRWVEDMLKMGRGWRVDLYGQPGEHHD